MQKAGELLSAAMADREIIDRKEIGIYSYGIQLVIEKAIGFIVIILISILFGRITQGLVFFIAYSMLRQYCGGYHAKRFVSCLTMSALLMLSCMIMLSISPLEDYSYAFVVVSAPVLFVLSPVETESKPLDKAETERYGMLARIFLFGEIIIFAVLFLVKLRSIALCIAFAMLLLTFLLVIQAGINRAKSSLNKTE